MIVFFVVAALLLISALLFVLPPLLGKRLTRGEVSHGETNLSIYRDQLRELDSDLANNTLDRTQYEIAKSEIERRVLEEVGDDPESATTAHRGPPQWTLAVIIAIAVPLAAIGMYITFGTPIALDPAKVAARAALEGGAHDMSPQQMAKRIEALKERMRGSPDDAEGWVMLAKTAQTIGRFDDAVLAFRQLVRLMPGDAQLLADFADALALANGRSLEGEPTQLIEQALKVDPKNVKALALGGTVAFQKKDYAKASQLWRRILEVVPPESDFAQRIQTSVAEAEQLGGIKGSPVATKSPAAAATGSALNGRVELDSAVAKSVGPDATVFVFARAANGPKMPLAVQRFKAGELPKSFELTEAMAMAPGMSISKFPDLVVGARVSSSGSATPQPGDWESELVPAKVGAKNLRLTISRYVR